MPHANVSNTLSRAKVKFIKSLGLKKGRIAENKFLLQGEKSVSLLIQSSYVVTLVVGTPSFVAVYGDLLQQKNIETFQVTPALLRSLGTLQENTSALAVAEMPAPKCVTIASHQYGLVLDDVSNPGNLGTILRVADWYGLGGVICSEHTVELYNPKVLQASMGSFLQVPVYYTSLPSYLATVRIPIVGSFTSGQDLHHPATRWPGSGLIVIGNEAQGISPSLIPYIQQRLAIPRYGQAESLNVAVATAVLCDNVMRLKNKGVYNSDDYV